MLKVCWDCLIGNRLEDNDAAYDSRVNRDTSKAWHTSEIQSENMFRLPRPLRINDSIIINGSIYSNFRGRLLVNLVAGMNASDDRNIVCQFEADFGSPDDSVKLNGKPDAFTVSELFPVSGGDEVDVKISVTLRVSNNNGSAGIDINVWDTAIGTFDLMHNLTDITFLTVNEELKVKELQFKYP